MPIELPEDLVDDARRGKPPALSAVIAACYPPLCRIAITLAGDAKKGLEIVEDLVRGSLAASEDWADAGAPWRWFLHHGILNLRRRGTSTGPDPLVQYSADKQLPFVAFVTALRKLPQQQIEAFILRHGESMKDRELAVAMDCSVTAATNHLSAAEGSLKLVAANDFDARLTDFRTAYENLSPDPESVRRYVAERVATKTVRRRTGRLVKLLVWLVILAAMAYGVWRAFQYMSA